MSDNEEPSTATHNVDEPKPERGPDNPNWIRNATAVVALLGTIAGICVSIWGLVAKSKADKEAADTNLRIAQEKASSDRDIGQINLEIAKDQLIAHKEEYIFQSGQHEKDQEQARNQYDREQRSKNEQRLTTIIDDLFSGSGYSEGKLDLLSTFITQDHTYDDLIANAIVAKVIYVKSDTEVAMAFRVLEKLHKSKAESLISINQSARHRYDSALVDRFWLELAREISDVPAWDAPTAGKVSTGSSPSSRLFSIVQTAEDKVLGDLFSESAVDDIPYAAAKINRAIYTNLRDLHSKDRPGASNPDHYAAHWEEIGKAINLLQPVSNADNNGSMSISVELLKRTSKLIPIAIIEEKSELHNPIYISDCYLWTGSWPSASYPSIQFDDSYIVNADFSQAGFDHGTWRSLVFHPSVPNSQSPVNSLLGDWQNLAPPWYMSLYLITSSSDKDLKVSPTVRSAWPELSQGQHVNRN